MISKERVTELALEKILELEYFLVDVKISESNNITILFDKEGGVVVRDCLYVSRHIESNLDRDIQDYQLTVCSPGIDKAFVVPEQYGKNIGRDVKIKTIEGDKIIGKLLSYSEENVIIETTKKQKKKKECAIKQVIVKTNKIKETKLIIKFK